MFRIVERGVIVMAAAMVVVVLSLVRPASADVAFPNTFTNGQPADASQVNQNFQAVNARQTASYATIAGTWKMRYTSTKMTEQHVDVGTPNGGQGTISLIIPRTSVVTFVGTLTLRPDHSWTIAGLAKGAGNNGESVNQSGSYTVNADGSGYISNASIGTINFLTSKDLNSMLMWFQQSDETAEGFAIRR